MYHLSQINIARLRFPQGDPRVAEFFDNIARINAIAESSPGFVWRFMDEGGDATGVQVFDDPMLVINMSVWESLEALKSYVFRSDHVDIMRKRREWFEKMETAHLAMWWVKAGHIPSLEEAKEKLKLMDRLGESPAAFTFRNIFEPV